MTETEINETTLESERLYPREEGETETEWANRIASVEEQYLALAAFKFLRIAHTFDEAYRHKLLQILSVVAPDPAAAEEKGRSQEMWKTIQGIISMYTTYLQDQAMRSATTPKSRGAGPAEEPS